MPVKSVPISKLMEKLNHSVRLGGCYLAANVPTDVGLQIFANRSQLNIDRVVIIKREHDPYIKLGLLPTYNRNCLYVLCEDSSTTSDDKLFQGATSISWDSGMQSALQV